MRKDLFKYLVLIYLSLCSISSRASHIFGLDFYYTHISGNTYAVNLVVYGDCSGAAFPSFPTSTPQVKIYNGNTLINTITLAVQPPATGIEVTPVCPADIGNTTCVNPTGTIPGIKKFVYTSNVTLPGTSMVWRFIFTGNMGSTSAGRSISITNVLMGPSGSTIQLTDTLNNTVYNNNGAIYTTIPTPFYCMYQPANFNPGAVDADGDSLRYSLAPAIDAATGSSLSYISPYTPAFPLGVTPGSFSFNPATGQLSFTPNISQKSLVVYNVREYRGGVFVGTTQREMTVVTQTCTNAPPSGVMSSPSAGTQVSPTQLNLCGNTGAFNFQINPTDLDGDTITMTASGLPAGATLAITNNTTTAPLSTFSWNTTGITPGTYTFFVNYQDRGCPITSSQTIAYSIVVLPVPTAAITVVSPVTCVAKAVFQVAPSGVTSPYTVKIMSGAAVLRTYSGISGTVTDSLVAGTYSVRISNSEGCTSDIPFTLAPPTPPSISATATMPLCYGASNGSITAAGSAGTTPYTFAIGSGTYGASSVFTGLAAGTYTITVKDSKSCTANTIVTVNNLAPMTISAGVTRPVCAGVPNGSVLLAPSGSTSPYTYAIGSGSYGSSSLFSGLAPGTYTFHTKSASGCIKDTIITLTDSLHIGMMVTAPPILCNGTSTTLTVTGTGSPAAYTYASGSSTYGTTNTFPVTAGTYALHVRDANMCQHDTTITLTQPTAGVITPTIVNVACAGANGSISVGASGGTPGYTYSINSGSFGTSSTFSPLSAGSYTIKVKDANGCIYTAIATVTEPSGILLDSVRVTRPTCYGSTNGSLQPFAHGGVTPYTYAIGSGGYSATSLFPSLSAGSYILHIRDANGCTKDTVINLTQPTPLAVAATVVRPVCSAVPNGSVSFIASGGTPAYLYAMGTGAFGTSSVFNPLMAGTYAFHIKDVNGCSKDTTITLTDSLHIGITASVPPILCNGGAVTVTLTGTGSPATYTYASGTSAYSSTNTFTLTAGTYALHVRDANMCQHDTTITLTQPTPGIVTPTIVNVGCSGANNGSISVSASGGTPSYTYNINSGSYGTSSIFSALVAGSYTLNVKDANGCIYTTNVLVTQPSGIVLDSARLTKPSCYGSTNGSLQLYAHGGVAPYTYAIGSGSYSPASLFTGLATGSYILHVKDANGCIKDTIVTLTQPPRVAVTAGVVRPICNTVPNGSVTLFASGGTPPYTYALGAGTYSASSAFSPFAAGTYAFHIKDANGCTKDTTITLTDSLHIGITVSTPPILCNGGVTLVTVGGTGSPTLYTYASGSSAFSTTNTFTLTAGTYTLHVRDANMCQRDSSVTITQPTPGVVTTSASNVACHGGASGIISVTASGGTAGYTYSINSGSYGTSSIFSPLMAGSYIIKVKDANGCIYTATTTTINEPAAITLDSVRVIKPTCFGSTNGSLQLYAHGGTAPYTYAIGMGPFSTTSIFTGLAAGTYTLHLKDANNCIKDTVINLLQPTRVAITANVVRPICSTLANGSVTLTGSGGTPSYTYALGTGTYGSTSTFSPLAAGGYAFHIKDANGCTRDTVIVLTDSLTILAATTASPALCYAAATGSITAIGAGGISPYTYAIGSGSYGYTGTFSGLTSATYTIHVKDNNGCLYNTTVSITQPTLLVPHISITNPTCYGYTNGSVSVSGTGGTPTYQYAINTGTFSPTTLFTSLGVGVKTIHIKDNNGCIRDTTATLTDPAPVNMGLTSDPIHCHGETGAVTVSGMGGTAPYWYAANGGGWQADNSFTGLIAATHHIHVKDNNGCSKDTSLSMTEPSPLTFTGLDTTNPTCYGYKDGSIELHVLGGTLPYQYAYNTSAFGSDNTFHSLGEGSYSIYVRDAFGCHIDTAIALKGWPPMWLNATIVPATCYGKADGAIMAQGGGAFATKGYQITGPSANTATDSIGGLLSGVYTITVTDIQNCKKDSSVLVPQPPALAISLSVVHNICDGYEDRGAITATVTGGTQPYKYKWNKSPSTEPTVNGLANGHYAVWVIDSNNCPIADTTNIVYEQCCKPFIPDAFTPNADGKNDVFRIEHKGEMKIVEFSVYNRFGEQVFTTSITDEGWDGRFRGIAADMGVYFYYARIICGTGGRTDITFLKGDVTLIR